MHMFIIRVTDCCCSVHMLQFYSVLFRAVDSWVWDLDFYPNSSRYF